MSFPRSRSRRAIRRSAPKAWLTVWPPPAARRQNAEHANQAEQMKKMVPDPVAIVGGASGRIHSASRKGGETRAPKVRASVPKASPRKSSRRGEIQPEAIIPLDDGEFSDF